MLFLVGIFGTWEVVISDALNLPGEPLDEIVIIAIDDKSLLDPEMGGWPFPRNRYAQVIDNCNESKVIGIDITFDLAREYDAELASSIQNSNVVLAMMYTELYYENDLVYAEGLLKPNVSLGISDIDFKVGFVNLYTDDLDKVTRSLPSEIKSVEQFKPFSLVIASEFLGYNPDFENNRMLINFFGEPDAYERLSFSDVYHGNIDSSFFNNKIVLIGYAASDSYDHFIVPISNQAMPGVEIHANLIQSIIMRDFIYYQDDFSAVFIILILSIITGLFLYKFKIHIATILVALLAISYLFLSVLYSIQSGIILKILYPLIAISSVYIGIVVVYYRTEEKSRKWITSLFGKYVSPIIIENLIKNPDAINLGGEKKNITIFFSDIRGFTTISEKLDPEDLVHLLNDYLTEMTSVILQNQGLVDKYMGDAIMAFWGAPLDQPNHAELSCISSLEMIDKLKDLQKKWKNEDIPSFDIGIGLNSGDAIIGNMGSMNRFDYTAMGDNVNLASRMEGLNKIYGTNIIITENTYNIIKDDFETRQLDKVRVKGKKKAIPIFELISKKGKLSEKQEKFIPLYEQALAHYFSQEWKQAIKSFEKAHTVIADPASKLLLSRCKTFIDNPPSKDWDGVWEMKTK
jgi:adenylate cyclase